MSNEAVSTEAAIQVFGLSARAGARVVDTSTGRILSQVIKTSRQFKEDGKEYQLAVELRFDDECRNGHETFAITGDLRVLDRGVYRDYASGCIHDEITKHFPELAHLVKWHLCSTDGPMHYEANTIYLAGDRDCNGRAAGEPSSFSYGVRFGNSPITVKLEKKFFDWVKARRELRDELRKQYGRSADSNPDNEPFQVVEVASDKGYSPKYTLKGFECLWYQCPFDTKAEAYEFVQAINLFPGEFVRIPLDYSKGKERDLNAARHSAAWLDSTDEELCQPAPVLRAALQARLPKLLEDFKADMLAVGFTWPTPVSK